MADEKASDISKDAVRNPWDGTTPEQRSEFAAALVGRRWAKTTPAERRAYARMMCDAKRKKKAESGS